MKIIVTGFYNTMKKPQKLAGMIYLPLHIFVLPLLIAMLAVYLPSGLDDVTANIIYYALGFGFCLFVMFRYLRTAFDVLLDNLVKVILAIVFSYIVYMMLNFVVSAVLLATLGDQLLNPNTEAVADIAVSGGLGPTVGLVVFIAPIVEEVLFRGVLFGAIRDKSRWLAYTVSILVFGIYHVWQFALVSMDITVLIYLIQYIPAGFALARCYEQTNCIWAPIFMHMFINGLGMAALTAL